MITPIIKSIDAVACVMKYLVAASVDRGCDFIMIIGIIENMFISRPIQTSNQWELIMVITVPKIKVDIIIIKIKGFISTGRV